MSCELEIYRLKSGDDNSFLRGFDQLDTGTRRYSENKLKTSNITTIFE